MNRVDWQDVERVLAVIMDLPATERWVHVAQMCGDRADLRAEVESLLAAHERAVSFLEVDTQVDSNATAPHCSLEGKALGPYRLLGMLGAGGMGTVYRAERSDGRFQKQVAIKVVPAALYSAELLRRFTNEQQILAALEHPNIARLLDAGVSPEGIPYFVMEHVEGIPVTEYCDAHQLSTRDRLKLFQTLCSAVQYAHQHLVVHRDLKPANILVSADGVPKLLDFGIAKIIDPWRAGNLEVTRSLLNPMTPAYASPEQVRGQILTTATDIYTLGVLLYELLTGLPPYQVTGKPLDEAIRLIGEVEPDKPTDVVRSRGPVAQSAPRHAPELSSDLDAIVAKAMRKDPQQRYASAEELATDVGRSLEGLPVSAHRGTRSYRTGKFVRRHRFGVGVAVAAAVMLLGFAIAMAVQAQRIAMERDRANREAAASKRVAEFMTNMFKVSDPNEARGNTVTAREILDNASDQIATSLSKDLELKAEMMDVMGRVYSNLGLYSRAHPLLEQSAETRLHVLGPEDPATLLSWHHLAAALDREGHFADAEKLERKTLDIRRRVLGPEHPDTLSTMNNLAATIEREARDLPDGPEKERHFAEVERLDREVLDIRRRVLGLEHPDTVGSMLNLGSTLDSAGRYVEAEKLQRETIGIQRRVLGPSNPATLGSMNNLGFTLEHLRRYPEAEKTYREALEIQQHVLGPNHPDTLLTMDNLNNTIAEQGRYAEAEKLCRETLNIRSRILGPEHPDTATSKYELACLLARQGRRDEALSTLRDAVDHGLPSGTDLDIDREEDFKSLHGDPRYRALVAHAKEHATAQAPHN